MDNLESTANEEFINNLFNMAVAIHLIPPEAFKYDDESRQTAGTRWPVWVEEFEIYAVGCGITDVKQKLNVFLHVAGKSCREVYSTKKEALATDNTYTTALTEFFTPLKNLEYECYNFSLMRQRTFESVDDFAVRLRVSSLRCEHGVTANAEIKKQLLTGCKNTRLKEHILATPGISLTDILTKARAVDTAQVQAKSVLEHSGSGTSIKSEPISAINNQRSNYQQRQHTDTKQSAAKKVTNCFACGKEYPHTKDKPCRALGNKCHCCGGIGHFKGTKFCLKNKNVHKPKGNAAIHS